MRQLIIDTLRYERAETLTLAKTLPEGVVGERPGGLAQSPAWIVCHLYLADNLLAKSLGLAPGDTRALLEDVGPGSDVGRARQALATHFGTWSNAIESATTSHESLLEAISAVSDESWSSPHPNAPVRAYFPTLGHNVVYNVWHEGNHGGQLRAWLHAARASGLVGVDA